MNSFRRAARIRLLSASGPGPPTIPWARELPGRAATSLPERQGNAKREQRRRMCPQPRLKPLQQPRPHVPRMTGSPSSWGEPAGGIIPFAHGHQGWTDGVLEGRVENREVCGRVQGPTPTQEHVVQAWKGWLSGGEFMRGRDGRWRDSARGPGGGSEPAPRPQEADGVLRSGADPPGRGPLGICSPAPKKCHSGTAHRERPQKRATGRETGTPATGERPPPGRCAAHT